jgi:hypothetical protein
VTVPGAADVDMVLPINPEDGVAAIDAVFDGVIGMIRAASGSADVAHAEHDVRDDPLSP